MLDIDVGGWDDVASCERRSMFAGATCAAVVWRVELRCLFGVVSVVVAVVFESLVPLSVV